MGRGPYALLPFLVSLARSVEVRVLRRAGEGSQRKFYDAFEASISVRSLLIPKKCKQLRPTQVFFPNRLSHAQKANRGMCLGGHIR
jgi:hypothetical protein